MSYWLVGESPNSETVGKPHLWLRPDSTGIPHAANRLLTLTGWDLRTYMRVFPKRTNVWESPIHLWIQVGRERARKIAEESLDDGSAGVVVLGSKAAEAFGIGGDPYFQWIGRFVSVPHPSGRSRIWNQDGVKERARAFFETLRLAHFAPPAQGGGS